MRRGGLLTLAAVSVALAGCGGAKRTLTATNSTTVGKVGVVKIYAVHETEFQLIPGTFNAPGQGNYAFKATNDGKLAHTLELTGPGIAARTKTIAPGKSTTFTVLLQGSGKYRLYDPKYRAKGMHATIHVP